MIEFFIFIPILCAVIPNLKMLAIDDYPTRAAAHPPRLRGGLGKGFLNVLVAFGELVLLQMSFVETFQRKGFTTN
jgi:hypothetical protein